MAIEEKQYLDPDGLKEVINQTDARYATKDLATTSTSGLMSSSDKTKLNSVESGANKTIVDSALSSTSTNPVQNKLINAVLIEIDSAIDEITENVSNLDTNKVDKISGKGLSTEDYTTAEKEKLAGIAEGANKTVVDSAWSATSENPLQNKVIYGMFDQLVSEFGDEISKLQEADANKANTSDLTAHTTDSTIHFTAAERTKLAGIATGANKTTVDSSMSTTSTNPVQNKVVQSAIQSVTDELSDHTSNSDIHFTAAERTKLAGVATGANKYTHPTSGVTAGTYKSVTVDTQGHVTSGTNPTTLAGYGITDAEAKGTVNTHNSSTSAHNDIRLLISNLTTQVTNFLDVDDTTKDQLSEVIALIEANADSIESITSGKVNVSDIINNLTTNVSNKPLSAAQGVVIKELIDDLQSALDTHTHNYAGSSSVGGAATSANKLNTNAGDSNTPVYFANGVPVACTSLDLNTTGNAETATKATQDSAGQQINTTYIKSLSASGKNLTYTKGNGTTATIDTQQNFITLTKAEYDALVSAGTVNEDCYYFITDDANTSPVLIQYITFAASGWTASDDGTYYTQSATATQITADDEPMVVKNLPYSTAASTAKAYNKAFGILTSGVGETADGVVNWKCYKKPATDITVGLIKVMA